MRPLLECGQGRLQWEVRLEFGRLREGAQEGGVCRLGRGFVTEVGIWKACVEVVSVCGPPLEALRVTDHILLLQSGR